jgi:hypothetical protein
MIQQKTKIKTNRNNEKVIVKRKDERKYFCINFFENEYEVLKLLESIPNGKKIFRDMMKYVSHKVLTHIQNENNEIDFTELIDEIGKEISILRKTENLTYEQFTKAFMSAKDEGKSLLVINEHLPKDKSTVILIGIGLVKLYSEKLAVLRMSENFDEYDLRMSAAFNSINNMKYSFIVDDTSAIKENLFVLTLEKALIELRKEIDELTFIDLVSLRGMSGFSRGYSVKTQLIELMSKYNCSIFNMVFKPLIDTMLNIGILENQFNFAQCIGRIYKGQQNGITDFLNNRINDYTISPKMANEIIRQLQESRNSKM